MKFPIKNKSLFSMAKYFLASTKKSKLLLCSNDQKMSVQNFYLNNENKDPQKYERRKIRTAFNKQRNLLKQQWENYYRLKWPQEKSYAIGTKTSKPATQKIIKKVYKFRYFETH